MSATNRKSGKRHDADFYPTPEYAVHALLKAWRPPFTGGWLEPGCGDGAIIRAVSNYYANEQMPEWTAIDIRGDALDFMQLPINAPEVNWIVPQDFLTWKTEDRFSVCLGNPPFSLAREFIEHAMTTADRVAMLLRLDYMGTQDRHEFIKSINPDLYILSKRPFPDSCEYAWFVMDGNGGRWFVVL